MKPAPLSLDSFPGRLGLQQRILPAYRAAFFDALAGACRDGLSVFAGQARPDESVASAQGLAVAHYAPAHNRHFLGPHSPFYLCWQDGFLPWLETWQPQALIVEANPRYRSTPAAVKWMHARGRAVIGWGLGAPDGRGVLGRWRTRGWPGFLRNFDALVAYSQRGAAQYQARGFPAERIFVAPNAVALRPTSPPPERPAEFRGPPVVLFIGRLQARKRIDNLLYACAAQPAGRQPRLLVIGDGPARGEFEALARRVYPAAEFCGAHSGAALEPFFAAADLFVLPGTGGLAVQQAMAHGLPVIVAQGDGTQDDLVRPQSGWRVPADDCTALGDALGAALGDAGRLRQMGAAAYRIVAAEINVERMVASFLEALAYVGQGKGFPGPTA